MANLNSIAKKLQKAILQKGLVVKMGTSQFYSVEQNRLITMYILSTRVLEQKKNGEWKYYDYEIIRTASQITFRAYVKRNLLNGTTRATNLTRDLMMFKQLT